MSVASTDKPDNAPVELLNEDQQRVIKKYTNECESEKVWTDTLIGLIEIAQYSIIVLMSLLLLVTTYLGFARHRGDVFSGEVIRLQGETATLRSRLDAIQNAERDRSNKAPMEPPNKELQDKGLAVARELDFCNRKLDQFLHGRYSDIDLPVLLSQSSLELETDIKKDIAKSGDASAKQASAPPEQPKKEEKEPKNGKGTNPNWDPFANFKWPAWLTFDFRLTSSLPAGYCPGLNLLMSLLLFVWGLLETIQRRFHWRERRILSKRSFEAMEQLKDSLRLLKLSDAEVQATVRGIVRVRRLFQRNRQALESEPPSLSDFNNLSGINGSGLKNDSQKGEDGGKNGSKAGAKDDDIDDPVDAAAAGVGSDGKKPGE